MQCKNAWCINGCVKIKRLEVGSMFTWIAWHWTLMSMFVHGSIINFSFFLLTTLRCPGLPGMQPGLLQPSLPSLSILSFQVYVCLLFLAVFALLLSVSDRSLSFTAVLLVIVLKTPVLFVAFDISPLALALLLQSSFSQGSSFPIGPSPLLQSLLLVQRPWCRLLSLTGIHTGCTLTFKWKYLKCHWCYSNAFCL